VTGARPCVRRVGSAREHRDVQWQSCCRPHDQLLRPFRRRRRKALVGCGGDER
jgi:hypothetical protein